MQLPPVQVVELFPEERAALIELLSSLKPDEWWVRSIGDWTVHDVALHLWGGDVNILSGGRDHYNGPPDAQPASDLSIWKNLVGFINNRNADWVSATRRISPPLLIELLADSGRQLNRYWPSLDLSATGPTVSWVGNGPMPMWVHVAREFTERWTHQQHIRDAVGRPGMTERRYLHPVLDTFVRALPYTLRTDPPPYWYPLVPQRAAATNPSMSFKLAATPHGRLLAPLAANPSLLLREDEVPREGARVTRAYQLARWIDGGTYLWLGRRKDVGRGEGSSGLRFDTTDA